MSTIAAVATLALPAVDEGVVGGPFDTITGLPLHPLVVHAAVVLLPLAALGLIGAILIPRWRSWLGRLSVAALLVATGAAFVAKESGEAMAARVGEPERHAELGAVLPLMAGALLVIGFVWLLLARRDERAGAGRSAATTVMAVLSIGVATLNLVWVVLVGHSGAQAVWAGRITATGVASGPQASASPSGSPSWSGSDLAATPTDSAPRAPSGSSRSRGATYTMAEVAFHDAASDCWTTIDGRVYDVTRWEAAHPGGAERIIELCGVDGTSAFTGEHSSQRRPNEALAGLEIGVLAQ